MGEFFADYMNIADIACKGCVIHGSRLHQCNGCIKVKFMYNKGLSLVRVDSPFMHSPVRCRIVYVPA